ncbi:alpha/beta fold hydrolase [Nitrospirillum iridis]|uniref:Pimeloyl-[acyl-carrier protein] methyl ester esterase n=1 Tax=Nitrospirillum iridis TaxID=765888 RepID=A0A7X0AVH4_9PROT|nr:alpha/beta hydrolase [Nitrospirillum iridis]MBB6250879.1 pimeloyl-[acyl-carrier protein] methyl ester esterase [Nitrospirillum iridis]
MHELGRQAGERPGGVDARPMTGGAGDTLACRLAGAGRPLVLLHGWATHGGFFEPQLVGLTTAFRILAPDLPGHGGSPAARPTVQAQADAVRALLARLDRRDAVLVGWSMGAMVAWRALLDGAADRVAGLVVVDMSPRLCNDADWPWGLRGAVQARAPQAARMLATDWATFAPRIARRIFAAGNPHAGLRRWAEEQVAACDAEAMASLWLDLLTQDFRSDLATLRLPTLVLRGALSQLYPAGTADWLTATLPQARQVIFADSGHAPHLEEPRRFNEIITGFAAGLPAPRGQAGNGDQRT